MATTRESIHDALAWIRGLLLVWLRWGSSSASLSGSSAWRCGSPAVRTSATAATSRPNSERRSRRSALPTEPAACTRGVYSARRSWGSTACRRRSGQPGQPSGWAQADRFLPLFYDLDVRCLRSDRTGVERHRTQPRCESRWIRVARRSPCHRHRAAVRSAGVLVAQHRMLAFRSDGVIAAVDRSPVGDDRRGRLRVAPISNLLAPCGACRESIVAVEVVFKRTGERRYAVEIHRPSCDVRWKCWRWGWRRWAAEVEVLVMDPAPGFDALLPARSAAPRRRGAIGPRATGSSGVSRRAARHRRSPRSAATPGAPSVRPLDGGDSCNDGTGNSPRPSRPTSVGRSGRRSSPGTTGWRTCPESGDASLRRSDGRHGGGILDRMEREERAELEATLPQLRERIDDVARRWHATAVGEQLAIDGIRSAGLRDRR